MKPVLADLDEIRRQVEARVAEEHAEFEPEADQGNGGNGHDTDQGIPTPKANKFRFESAESLCKTQTPTEWLIKKILEMITLALLFGDSATMKTFVAIDMGLCVACGLAWLGHHAIGIKGAVFYICGEGKHGIRKRLLAWSQDKGIPLTGIPFFISDRPAQFLGENSTQEIEMAINELLKTHGKPVLIIIDTLARNFAGDENSAKDMGSLINSIDKLKRDYESSILIVAHSGLTEKSRVRGSSALRAAMDFEYMLTGKDMEVRKLVCTKAKDHEPPHEIHLEPTIVDIEGLFNEEAVPETSIVLKPTSRPSPGQRKPPSPAEKIALCVFEELTQKDFNRDHRVHIDKWRDLAYERGITPSSIQDSKKKAFQQAVKGLQKKGYVKAEGNFWEIIPLETG